MTTDRGVRVKPRAQVATLTRVATLARIAREVARASCVTDESSLSIIYEAIQNQSLEMVEVEGFGRDAQAVAYLSFSIDWDLHRGLLRDSGVTKEFVVDLDQPVTGQVSRLLGTVVEYIRERVDELGVQHTIITYTWRAGKRAEAGQRFKTVPITDADKKRLARSRQLERKVVASDGAFPDGTILFRSAPSAKLAD